MTCILNVRSCRLTVARRVSLVQQEVLTLPNHLSSLHVYSEVRVARSLVFCVVFCKSVFVLFSFGHGVVCVFFDIRILITPLVLSSSS